jgi:formate/nitrite transporter
MMRNSQTMVDALLPSDMARAAERIGAAKAKLDTVRLLALAVLAGAFIAFGAMFFTIATAGAGDLPYGLVRVVAGMVFSLGLILVVVGGAELFTGNNLMVMAWAGGKVATAEITRAWTLVYLGNFTGATATAVLVYLSGMHEHGGGTVGDAAVAIFEMKAALPFLSALAKGVLGNVLVCLAVWLSYGARTTTDKILAIVPPISAFVAAGFEHSIANMYFIAYGILVNGGTDPFAAGLHALWSNLVPVTIGNIIGGGVFVGAVYWFIYLRKSHVRAGWEG